MKKSRPYRKSLLHLSKQDLNRRIFRIIPFERLVQIFDTNSITLVKPSLWDDPFENLFLNQKMRVGNEELSLEFKDQVYGQCWTLNIETDAMWRIYSPLKDGVKIQTTIGCLLGQIIEHEQYSYIGQVKYLGKEKMKVELTKFIQKGESHLIANGDRYLVSTLLLKRIAFRHEKEIRLIIFDAKKKYKNLDFITSPVKPMELIKRITFDPRLPFSIFKIYKAHIRSLGFKGEILRSTLYDPPPQDV